MAETTASTIFSSPNVRSPSASPGGNQGGGGSGGGEGGKISPDAALPFFEGITGAGKKADDIRLSEDPFRKAAEEQDARFDEALAKAKEAQVTTSESGTQEKTGTSNQTSQTTFDARSQPEQELLDSSISNYKRQQDLVGQQEAGIAAREGLQTSARGGLQSIIGGEAFDLSPSEQARIDRLRGADIAASSDAVNNLLNERLAMTSADAARRGIRGQAFTQLQGDAIAEAARNLNTATLDANRNASNLAVTLPGQRAGVQAQTAGQFADFGDQLQQQAIQNRQSLQDPIALQQMLDERLKGGKTTTSGTTSDKTTSTGTSTQTGAGQADILLAKAGQPSKTGAQTAGALGIGQVVGEIIPG